MAEKTDENELKKEYQPLQKKFNLPSFDSLENDFGMMDEETDKYVLSKIRRKMSDKIDFYISVLGNIFEGDATLSNIYESKVFDEESKTELFKIYKRLMRYGRDANILSLTYDERAEAEYIKEFYKEWQHLKEGIKKQLVLFRDIWDSETNTNEDILNYLG